MTLLQEIAKGEIVALDFKEARPKDALKFVKTVVAFANGRGGGCFAVVFYRKAVVNGVVNDVVNGVANGVANVVNNGVGGALMDIMTGGVCP